jgi:hypothetical protein
MATTVSIKTFGRSANIGSVAAVKVSIDANSVSYATSLGGLALDLYTALSQASVPAFIQNGNDVVGIQPLGLTSPGKFLPTTLTVGTVTSTSVPCYLKFVGTGTAASAGLAEIADGACTQTCDLLVLVARGGQN